jgi:membrane-bound lytic murein transglycosylase MltF
LTRVPFRFCSIALIMAFPSIPTAADFGKRAAVPGRQVTLPGKKISVNVIAKKQEMNLSLANEQGKEFVDNYLRHNDEDLHVVKQRSEGPFSIIDSVLGRYGLPQELRYLAVIESDLKSTALSRVGARGPWQLMPTTAHELGLKVNRNSDDRVNYYKSTVAAAKYLRDLHREFGDWLLVLAAYNGGPVPVYRAIHRAHSRSFWVLQNYLPAESRGHVKKFIATAFYFEAAERAEAAAKSDVRLVSVPVRATVAVPETDDDKFQRLMKESAHSLKESKELLNN